MLLLNSLLYISCAFLVHAVDIRLISRDPNRDCTGTSTAIDTDLRKSANSGKEGFAN